MKAIKKTIYEWLLTFSMKKSLISSKKLERFSFVALSELIVAGTFVYLIYAKTLVATDAIILITPLLFSAGYNLVQTEKEKQNNKKEETNE